MYQAQPSESAGPGMYAAANAYAQQHFAQNHVLQEQLKKFWGEMMEDVQGVGTDPAEFKSQQLPLARVKKVNSLRLFLTVVLLFVFVNRLKKYVQVEINSMLHLN